MQGSPHSERGISSFPVRFLLCFALDHIRENITETLVVEVVFHYYRGKNVEAYQIVPDESHWTIDVPDLSQPWTQAQAPGWRWLKEEWKYPVSKTSVALTDLPVLRGG
jgi:hypothetical protein